MFFSQQEQSAAERHYVGVRGEITKVVLKLLVNRGVGTVIASSGELTMYSDWCASEPGERAQCILSLSLSHSVCLCISPSLIQ